MGYILYKRRVVVVIILRLFEGIFLFCFWLYTNKAPCCYSYLYFTKVIKIFSIAHS